MNLRLTSTLPFPPLATAALLLLGLSGCAPTLGSTPFPLTAARPWVVIESATGDQVDLDRVAEVAATGDALFVGELHDDSIGHVVEVELLRLIGEHRDDVVLGLEMFERDTQSLLEQWLSDEIDEEAFLAGSRPWPNYRTDYRPLVILARDRGWPIVATNLPQPLASTIARGGLASLNDFQGDEIAFAPADFQCGDGEYWNRFIGAMTETSDSSGHPSISEDDPMMRNMFEAQCGRDEAMAESLALIAGSGDSFIFHVNGSFHSNYRLGTVSRILRRQPQLEVRVVSIISLEGDAVPDMAEHAGKGDYLIFTP